MAAQYDSLLRCAWEWEMRGSHRSRGIPIGMKIKLLKLMGMGQELE